MTTSGWGAGGAETTSLAPATADIAEAAAYAAATKKMSKGERVEYAFSEDWGRLREETLRKLWD